MSSSLYLFDGKIQEKDTSYGERGKLKRERKKKQRLCLFCGKVGEKKDTRLKRRLFPLEAKKGTR